MITIQRRKSKLFLAPGKTERVEYRASYIAITGNSTNNDVLVSADSGSTSAIEVNTGFPTVVIQPDGTVVEAMFSYVDFTNPSDTEPMEINYLLCLGRPDDNRTQIRGYIQMDLSAPRINSAASLAVPSNARVIAPADARVKERLVQNSGACVVWWGDETVSAADARGNFINPGSSSTINCWGAVHFIAEGEDGRISINNILKV